MESTFWKSRDFMGLRNFTTKHVFSDIPSNFISDEDFMSRTLNFIFVRNPFTRLSSLYIKAITE